MNSLNGNSQFFDFLESELCLRKCADIVAELSGKGRGKVLRVVFGDGDSPEDFHFFKVVGIRLFFECL